MDAISIVEAKAQLSQLVDRAAAGEDVIVSRRGKPLVRITRLETERRPVRYGLMKGRIRVGSDFDAPLPADALAGFIGR
jgi:prevent-host-death family protein